MALHYIVIVIWKSTENKMIIIIIIITKVQISLTKCNIGNGFYATTKKKCITKDYEIKIVNRNSEIARIPELEITNEKNFYWNCEIKEYK